MHDEHVDYGSPVIMTAENGMMINITSIFWDIVREARLCEMYGSTSMKVVKKAGYKLAAALGDSALTPIIGLMSDHIPDDYEIALKACWQGIIDEHNEDEDDGSNNLASSISLTGSKKHE